MDLQSYLDLILNIRSKEFSEFKELLLESNKKYNLTSICGEKEVIYKHFLDSIAGESYFPLNSKVAEIGSGGGFPSVPLMIVREDLKFTLIESTGKKCGFLREAVNKLNLNCEQVLNIRAEDGARDKNLRESFGVVCARAVARLNTLAEYCLPYCAVGGRFIAYKGECAEEIDEAQRAVKLLGGEIEEVVKYELFENFGKRTLVVIRKVKSTPQIYPRGLGKERKNPL